MKDKQLIMIFGEDTISIKKHMKEIQDEKLNAIPDIKLFIYYFPEYEKHPFKQIEFMDNISEKIRNGEHILLCSHSNYIMNKTNNLILSKHIDWNTIVSIWINDNEERELMKINECGIEDEAFYDCAESLWCEREEILDELNERGECNEK